MNMFKRLLSFFLLLAVFLQGASASVRFDAAGDKAKCASSPTFASSPFTYMVWVKLIVDRDDYSSVIMAGGTPNFQGVQTSSDGTTLVFWDNSVETSGSALSVGTWYHIAWTHSSANVNKVYINGVLDITVTQAGGVTNTEFEYGSDEVGGTAEWANAEFDYPRVWAAELSGAEVSAEYASSTPVKASPWSYYDFANATGAATDQSGNSRPLTLTTLSNGASRPTIGGGGGGPAANTGRAMLLGAGK